MIVRDVARGSGLIPLPAHQTNHARRSVARMFGSGIRRMHVRPACGRARLLRQQQRAFASPSAVRAPPTEAGSLVEVEVPGCKLQFGEHLRLVGSCEELGGWDAAAAPKLEWGEGDSWSTKVALPAGEHAFKLVVVRSNGSQHWEEGDNRQLAVGAAAAASASGLRVIALFGNTAGTEVQGLAPTQDAAGEASKGVARPMQGQFGTINPFKLGAVGLRTTSAAPQVSRRRMDAVRTAAAASTVQSTNAALVEVEVPGCKLQFGEHLRLVGSCEELGGWDAAAAPKLEWGEGDNWSTKVALPAGEHAFKLVVVRGNGSQHWEEGDNRQLAVGAAAAASASGLRVVALFGNTADTEVAQPTDVEAESKAAEGDAKQALSVNGAASVAEGRAVAPKTNGFVSAPSSVDKRTPAASEPVSTVSAGSRSAAARLDVAGRQQRARELAEAWRRSKAGKATPAGAAPAAKQETGTTVLSFSRSQPVQAAATSMAASAPAAAAVASTVDRPSGSLLLPLFAGIVCLGAAALSALPGLELTSGRVVDASAWTSAAAAAAAAMQHTLASLFAAFMTGSAEVSQSAAERVWALPAAASEGLGSLQAAATSGWAALQADAGASGLGRSAAHAVLELEREGGGLLGSLAATSSDVMASAKTGSGAVQAGLADGVASLEASAGASFSGAQAAATKVVSEAVSSLRQFAALP